MATKYNLLLDPYYIHHINSKKPIFEDKIRNSLQLHSFRISDKNILFPKKLYRYILENKRDIIKRNRELYGCFKKAERLSKSNINVICISKNPKQVKTNIVKGFHRDIYNYFLECFDKIHNSYKPVVILRIGDHLKKYEEKLILFFKEREYACSKISIPIYGKKHDFLVCYKS